MINYTKMKKEDLIKELNRLKKVEAELEKTSKNLEKTKINNGILVNARKEDKEVVEKAQIVVNNFEVREKELKDFYEGQRIKMKKQLDEQNETIGSLFDMMDNTINIQILYYTKFKNIFLGETSTDKED